MAQLIDGYFSISVSVIRVLFIIMAIGFGGYQASIYNYSTPRTRPAT